MVVSCFGGGLALPDEVVEDIAFMLLALTPLGSMAPVIPLLQVSKAFHQALSPASGTSLYARLCRLKFDVGAAERRTFTPTNRELTGHFIRTNEILRRIRKCDVFDEQCEDTLLNALVMMLHDDGKNRAQLENAGAVVFVNQHIRLRLHEAKETNDMWPIETVRNSAVLWLSWLFTTREQLESETAEQRADFVNLLLPLLISPFRYASGYAPSNHFRLPLEQEPPNFRTVHGAFPVYHTKRQSASVLQDFHSSTSVLIPPMSAAAKLLFWARRELKPFFNISLQIPKTRSELGGNPGLTAEDLVEFNSFKVARLRPIVRWDWEHGLPMTVNDDGTQDACTQEWSRKWDTDWWRMRLCRNIMWKQPRWRQGNVYERGLLTGLWQGVYFLSNNASLTEVLRTAQCPEAVSGLFELLPRPMFVRLQEHGFMRISKPSRATYAESTSHLPQPKPVPVAKPPSMSVSVCTEDGVEDVVTPTDVSISNAWIPGPVGSLKWYEGEPLQPPIRRDAFMPDEPRNGKDHMRSMNFVVSPGLPSIFRDNEFLELTPSSEDSTPSPDSGHRFLYETYEPGKESVHAKVEKAKDRWVDPYGISLSSVAGPDDDFQPGCLRCVDQAKFLQERRERDRARRSTSQELLRDDEVEAIFTSIGMGKRRMLSTDGEVDYEVEVDEDEDDRVLDLGLEFDPKDHTSSGRVGFSATPHALSVRTLGWQEIPTPASVPTTLSPSSSASRSSPPLVPDQGGPTTRIDEEQANAILFDLGSDHPTARDPSEDVLYDRFRPSGDRYRVEGCNDGIEDTIVTGEPDERHRLAWGNCVYYGRVRPWDGMIAILKQHPTTDPWNYGNFLFYGYIHGGDTFVGNWRFASLDPLTPAFEAPFIMSKRPEDQ